MSEHRFREGTIRKLWPTEVSKFRDYLLRLDPETRRLRFAHGVSDAFIEEYATRLNDNGAIVFGFFENDELRAAAELYKLGLAWGGGNAEAAFSVEAPYQNQGIGTELMGRVVQAARNRGVRHLYMTCLAENGKMQNIAHKHRAFQRYEHGDVIGEILPPSPGYLSLFLEAMEDRVDFLVAVLDLHERALKTA
jgi:GNAT superfamily N-acetyltransferase